MTINQLSLVSPIRITYIFPIISTPIIIRSIWIFAVFYSFVSMITGRSFLKLIILLIVKAQIKKAYEGMILFTLITLVFYFLSDYFIAQHNLNRFIW